jgi:hypothetical protein
MAYPSAASSGPQLSADLSATLPYETTLKNGSRVRLERIVLGRQKPDGSHQSLLSSPATVSAMRQIINHEIVDRGDSYPFEHALTRDQFETYYFSHDTFCLRLLNAADAPAEARTDGSDDPCLVGCFYIKPNYPGRCAHVCNGGFLVRGSFKGLGAGYVMGERYRHLAKALGYRASMFNLVFVSNHGSNRLWEVLGFTRLARVPGVGRLRDWESPAQAESSTRRGEVFRDAYQWYLELHDKEIIPYMPAAWELAPTIGGKPVPCTQISKL